MKKFIIFLIFFISFTFLYARYINPSGFTVHEFTINTTIDNNYNGFKIVHLSDTLINEYTTISIIKEISDTINNLHPDIIIFTGDLIDDTYKLSDEDKQLLIEYLKSMECTLYKYAISGNNDDKNIDQFKTIMEESDFQLIDDKSEYLFYEGINPIKLIGAKTKDKLPELLANEEGITPTITIALTHYSDNFSYLQNEDIDIVFSGNSLGGQIRLPFLGSIIKKEGSKTYIEAFYQENNTQLYINNGIGTEKYPFRTFNKPSIYLYRLTSN